VALTVLLVWLLSEFGVRVYLTNTTGRRPRSFERDRGSGAAILLGLLVAVLLPPILRATVPGPSFAPWAVWLGLALALGGVALRVWSLVTLGRFFSTTVEVQAGHRLVRTGPYRRLRHPSYTAILLIVLGYGLAVADVVGALVALCVVLGVLLYRIHVEEGLLAEHFPEEYRAYQRESWRLVPGVY
jgi:protein-S-isoprenylcysteine O-methyltransferase